MTSIRLKLRPLDAAEFAPFGQVLTWREGDHPRRNYAAMLFSDRPDAKPNLRVQRTEPSTLPFQATLLERHLHSSQTFVPISGGPYVVIVFPSDQNGDPILSEGIAFVAAGDQAVNYGRGTWHHGFMAKDRAGSFLMLRWEDGSKNDEEFLTIATPVTIEE